MQKTVQSWNELLALPEFRLPDSDRRWKIEPINDDGDMGLYALRIPLTQEWVFVAHVTEPEPGHPIVAVNHPFGVAFMHKIKLTDIKYQVNAIPA